MSIGRDSRGQLSLAACSHPHRPPPPNVSLEYLGVFFITGKKLCTSEGKIDLIKGRRAKQSLKKSLLVEIHAIL